MVNVTSEQELRDAVTARETPIIVDNDITLTTTVVITYDLELSSGDSSLLWTGLTNGTMITVNGGAVLAIEHITLDGGGNYVTLVSVNASTFIMNEGAIIRNVQTNSACSAVLIGSASNLSIGGTFLMNSGEITAVSKDVAVDCFGGTVTMSGDAAITGNQAYGIGLQQGTLNMTDNARISDNITNLPAAGVLAHDNAVVNMGLKDGDSPRISDNESTNSYVGGIYLVGGCTLNMNYHATISGNKAAALAGGVGLNQSRLLMEGQSSIIGNTAEQGAGGGIFATAASTINMADDVSVTGNQVTAADGKGGGIYLQETATLLVTDGNASITGNLADYGAGIYISTGTEAVLADNTVISGNIAGVCGLGVFNNGKLTLMNHAQISDGLHFVSADHAPYIGDNLSELANIQLEASDCVSPDQLPVLCAVKGDTCTELTATDRGAFLAPDSFPEGTPVYLNLERDQVLLGLDVVLAGALFSVIRIR